MALIFILLQYCASVLPIIYPIGSQRKGQPIWGKASHRFFLYGNTAGTGGLLIIYII